MPNNSIWIEDLKDLSAQYGSNFIEFETSSKAHFNEKLAEISRDNLYRMMTEIVDKKFINRDITDTQTQLMGRQNINTLRLMTNSRNFLLLPFDEIRALKQLINSSLHHYLKIFKREYNGNAPNKIHAWALVFKNKYIDEVPHIHHYNPMNISGVYYVCGDFYKGNGELEVCKKDANLRNKQSYLPRPGKLVLFPATLPHTTGNYKSNHLRICIAFDIWFKAENSRMFISLS
jgi:hypothetical protein